MRSERRSKDEETGVVFAGGYELHAARGEGDGDGRHPGEAGRRGIAQEALAGLAVVGAGGEAGDGGGREEQQFVLGEERVHAGAKCLVAGAERGDGDCAEACAPLEALADGGLELGVVATVDLGCFGGLNGGEDFH